MPTHKPRRSRQPSEWARQKHSAKPSVILRQLRKLPIRFGRVFFINRFSVFVVVFRVCQKPQCKDVLLVKVNGGNGAKPLPGDVGNEHRLPLPAVTRSTDANGLRMSINRFHLAAFTTASQRSKEGRVGGCRRVHYLSFRWFYHTQGVNEEKLFFGLACEAGGVGAVGVVLDRVQ